MLDVHPCLGISSGGMAFNFNTFQHHQLAGLLHCFHHSLSAVISVPGGRIRYHAPLHIMKFLEVLRLFRAAAAECLWTAAALGLGRLLDIGWYGRLGKVSNSSRRICDFDSECPGFIPGSSLVPLSLRERCERGYNIFIGVRHGSVAGRIQGTMGTLGDLRHLHVTEDASRSTGVQWCSGYLLAAWIILDLLGQVISGLA